MLSRRTSAGVRCDARKSAAGSIALAVILIVVGIGVLIVLFRASD